MMRRWTCAAVPLNMRLSTQQQRSPIPGVKHIVAVASGKGGVGKSTTAVNLAVALSARKLRVGICDADLHGPSIHRMMNLSGRPDLDENNFFIPKMNYGVQCMSMGSLVEEGSATIWRGPMVIGTLRQLLRQTKWNILDVLVLDLPPGTGDIALTIAQEVPVSGAVMVTTPQDIALIDVERGVNMFRRVNVPILGMVENMSHFVCPSCATVSHIFGEKCEEATARLDLHVLGRLPLDIAVRQTSDDGTPIVVLDPTSTPSKTYAAIAAEVAARLEGTVAAPGPTLSIV